MTCAFRRTTRVVQFFGQFEFRVSVCLHKLLQVVWIHELSVQIVQYILKRFLSAPHISFLKSFTAKGSYKYLFKSVPNLFWFNHLFEIVYRLRLLVFAENVFQVAKQANFRLQHLPCNNRLFLQILLKNLLKNELIDLSL